MRELQQERTRVRFRDLDIPDESGHAMTVLGRVAPDRLGQTLMHEHLLLEYRQNLGEDPEQWTALGIGFPDTDEARRHWTAAFTSYGRQRYPYLYPNKDAWRLDSVDDAAAEARLFKSLGGSTIVDVTPIGVGRNPVGLTRIAREGGVNVVMGTGFYVEPHLPPDLGRRPLDDLTAEIVTDIVRGADGTDIRSGIIGEVGITRVVREPQDSTHVRSLRASARASRLTGAAITLHARPHEPAGVQEALDVLAEEGADLSRVVVGHVNGEAAKDVEALEAIMSRGVFLQFDLLGYPFHAHLPATDQRPMLEAIVALIARGYVDQLLVSHDVAHKTHLAKYGGWGFTFVHEALRPYLHANGVRDEDFTTMLEVNPRRVLTFVAPQDLLA